MQIGEGIENIIHEYGVEKQNKAKLLKNTNPKK
jgi:hypothetical protein